MKKVTIIVLAIFSLSSVKSESPVAVSQSRALLTADIIFLLYYPFVSPHPYDKLIIHLRFLKITNDTISLNISSVVSNVYTPTISQCSTYAANIQRGIPIHHVPIVSIIMMIFVLPPLLMMPPPKIIFSTLTGAYRANTIRSICPSSFTL